MVQADSMTLDDHVVATRFHPAALPAVSVRRERLLRSVDRGVRSKVLLVVAPTGYGKSVLLAQWAAQHRRSDVRWLNAEPADSDPSHFAAALKDVLTGREGSAGPTGPAPVYLVIDDIHLITNALALDELFTWVTANPYLHVVLVGRSDPCARLHRLRLSDEIAEIRQKDLSFEPDEARELLELLARRSVRDEELASLNERTEGWAAGLHLAGVSLRSLESTTGFVQVCSTDDRYVNEFLTAQILELQDPDVRAFLLGTSVLHDMSASLCDHVLRIDGSREILHVLERGSVVVSSVSSDREWFRYHGLVRALLRQHLRFEQPDAEGALLRRAAAWHADRGDLVEAVDYLVEAGDADAAADLVCRRAGELLLDARRPRSLVRCIEHLPAARRTGDSTIALLELAARVLLHDLDGAERLLRRLGLDDSMSESDLATLATFRTIWLSHHHDPQATIAAAEEAIVRFDACPPQAVDGLLAIPGLRDNLLGAARLAGSAALLSMGRLDAATEMVEPLLESTHSRLVVQGNGLTALAEALAGRLNRAVRHAERALRLAEDDGLSDDEVTGVAVVALAVVSRERQRLDEAGAYLEVVRRRSMGSPFLAGLLLVEEAELILRRGRVADWPGVIDLRWAE